MCYARRKSREGTMRWILPLVFGLGLPPADAAQDQAAFRALYKELVETNTTYSAGNCTEAATKMAARLKAAGYPDKDLIIFSTPEHPKEGGLVAFLPGSDAQAKAV